MKIKVVNATFATLEIVMDLAASQRAMNNLIIQTLARNEDEVTDLTEKLNEWNRRELDLIRARVFRHSEIHLDDLLNGTIDI